MQDGGVDGTGAPLPVSEEVKEVESELEVVKTLLEDLQSEWVLWQLVLAHYYI